MDDDETPEEGLRPLDEARREDRAARAAATKVHGIIPYGFFSAASSECRELYLDGHFYGCISLSQAVAEGLSKFVCRVHSVRKTKDPEKRVRRLAKKGLISAEARAAFLTIWGNDRNTFHHLNEDITDDSAELGGRAKECVDALYVIESEIFAFELAEGAIRPLKPEYWPTTEPGRLAVYLRLA